MTRLVLKSETAVRQTLLVASLGIVAGCAHSQPATSSTKDASPAGTSVASNAPNESGLEHTDAMAERQEPATDSEGPGSEPPGPASDASAPDGATPHASGPNPATEGQVQVTDEEVQAFAVCHLKLTELGQRMNSRVEKGESPSVVEQDFQAKAGEVINDSPLSERRYFEIAQLTKSDVDLQRRIEEALREQVSG